MTKDTFINSFGEKMIREKPSDPSEQTITITKSELEQIKDSFKVLYSDVDGMTDHDSIRDYMNDEEWIMVNVISDRFQTEKELNLKLNELTERLNKNGVEEKENKTGTNSK